MTVRETAPGSVVRAPSRSGSWLYDPTIRGILYQVALALFLVLFGAWVFNNTVENLRAANIASGFGFMSDRAGFDIAQKPIEFTPDDTHGRAFSGQPRQHADRGRARHHRRDPARLHRRRRAPVAELAALQGRDGLRRDLPQRPAAAAAAVLVQGGALRPARAAAGDRAAAGVQPLQPRSDHSAPVAGDGFGTVEIAILLAVAVVFGISRWAKRRQEQTGQIFPVFRVGLAILIGLPLAAFLVAGAPLTFEYPELKGFNFVGGFVIKPELMALLLGLIIYTGAFIAEVVRAGIMAISHGRPRPPSRSVSSRASPCGGSSSRRPCA